MRNTFFSREEICPKDGIHLRPKRLLPSVDTESRMVVTRYWGAGAGFMGSCCILGTEFQFCKMEKVL